MRERSFANRAPKKDDKYNVNEDITAREVRVIGVDGAQLGVLTTVDAIKMAEELGVDVVEVAPEANPPVCRLLDYGKLKYKEQKKAAETRKRSAQQAVKELRVRYSTDEHDLDTKVRAARKFLEGGDRVRFQMRFRGREVVYQNLGRDIFDEIVKRHEDIGTVDERSPLIGQRMILSFAPKSHK